MAAVPLIEFAGVAGIN